MTVLAIAIAAYGLVLLIFAPNAGPPFLAVRFRVMPLATWAHVAGGLLALAIGPFQLNRRLRARHLAHHRWLGRVYLFGIAVGGSAAWRSRSSRRAVRSPMPASACSPFCGWARTLPRTPRSAAETKRPIVAG
jgi:hypothetical protein